MRARALKEDQAGIRADSGWSASTQKKRLRTGAAFAVACSALMIGAAPPRGGPTLKLPEVDFDPARDGVWLRTDSHAGAGRIAVLLGGFRLESADRRLRKRRWDRRESEYGRKRANWLRDPDCRMSLLRSLEPQSLRFGMAAV